MFIFLNHKPNNKKNYYMNCLKEFNKRKLLLFIFFILAYFNLAGQTYHQIQLTGFNTDIIAEGSGGTNRAAATTSAAFDLTGPGKHHVFYSTDFRGNNNAGTPPPYGLPVNRIINSVANAGYTYLLESYTGDNALFLTSGTGSLTLNTPAVFEKISFLGTSITPQSITVKITFTDLSSTDYTATFPDWYAGAGPSVAGIGRVTRADDGAGILPDIFDGDATKPNLFDCIVTLNAADKVKLIKQVEFSGMTSSIAVLGMCGVTPAGAPAVTTANAATSINPTGFQANWTAAAGATGYRIDISKNAGFSSFVTAYHNSSAGSGTSVVITGLENSTTYYYRLRAENANGQSVSSNTISLTTLGPLPTIPLAKPATAITASGFTANWDAAIGATNYRIDISTSNIFASILPAYNDLAVAGTFLNVTGLTSGTTYYYRVRAENISGESDNSGNISALTLPVPPVINAATGISATGFTANWTAATGATKYRLDVSTVNTFATFTGTYNNLDIGNVTTIPVTGLLEGVTYYYRLRAENATGQSINSAVQTISTVAGAPVASAATSVTAISFSANWTNTPGALKYRLDVATNLTFTNILPLYSNLDVGNVITYPITGLQGGTTYYYRVRAENGSGPSPNSGVITVLTLPAAPVAAAATLLKSTSFQANWAASVGATKYRIDVSTVNTFATFVTGFNDLDIGNVLTIPVTGLTFSTTYYYRVRAENTQGKSVSSNIITAITTLPDPVNLNLAGIDAITSQITNTTVEIQYSLDSTSVHAGTWTDCLNTNTTVNFGNGGMDIWVRQKNLISNKRKVGSLPAKVILVSGVTYDLVDRTISGLNNNEQYRMNAGTWSTAITDVLFTPGKFEVYIPATLTTLASTIEEIGTLTASQIAFANIQRYAELKDASELTPEMLTEAGVINTIPENISGYQQEIENTTVITSLVQVQGIVERSNAFYNINYITQSKNASSLTIIMLTTAGVTGANANYLDAYKEAIIYNDSPFATLLALQEFVDLVNVMMDISTMATNDDASTLTMAMLVKAGVTNTDPEYLVTYKKAVETENSIENLQHLQNVINRANLQQDIFNMAVSNNASALTINMLSEAGITEAYDVNLEAYKIMITEDDFIADLAELQEYIHKGNAQQFLFTKTVLTDQVKFTLDLLITAGVTGGVQGNLQEYLKALEETGEITNLQTFQSLITKVNAQQIVFAMATASDASALTPQLLIDAGVINVTSSFLPDYKTAIAAKDNITTLAQLQEVIEIVNIRFKIFNMAVSNDASELTSAMLVAVDITEVSETNLDAYKNAIVADNEIVDLAELQLIINKTNAQQIIFSKQILQNTNQFTTNLLVLAGISNSNENYLAFYLNGIDKATSINSLADLQTIINKINAQQTIFAMATNADALTEELMTTAGLTGVNNAYIIGYRKAVVAKESISNIEELQGLIDMVNLQNFILNMAVTNDASTLTMEGLETAGFIEIYDVNLEAYKKAIIAEDVITDTDKLQQIIIRTNAQEYIFTKTILSNQADFTIGMLEMAGAQRANTANIPFYISELEAGNELHTLIELQALIDRVNARQLILKMPVSKDTSVLSVDLLTAAGISGARSDKLNGYKKALADSSSLLNMDQLQILINKVNSSLKIIAIADASFRIYPIPARDILHIESKGIFTYKLFNSSGKTVLIATSENDKRVQISLSGLEPGVYFVIIQMEGNVYQKKIVKL